MKPVKERLGDKYEALVDQETYLVQSQKHPFDLIYDSVFGELNQEQNTLLEDIESLLKPKYSR